jgi:small subunit ribosomal protein S1
MTESSQELKKKDRVTGKVVKTSLAGALVDIGRSKPAVIPISQLRKDRVSRVEDVVKEGDQIEAWVWRLDTKQERIELTMIQPLGLEWHDIKKDSVLKGKVSKLDKFGAFVEVGAERPGLVHISEMSNEYVKTPGDVVKVGEEIEVKVLDVDKRKKQIKLSMKALLAPPEEEKVEVEENQEPEKPVPTAMEVALRKAMGQDEDNDDAPVEEDKPIKPSKRASKDIDELLERTLENRVRSK